LLSDLSIKNYALIDTLQVQFDSGFTSITGETGAGKSILLGGLALVLGKRADYQTSMTPIKNVVLKPRLISKILTSNHFLRSMTSILKPLPF